MPAPLNNRLPLPEWAEPSEFAEQTIVVDPDKAYPAILGELGVDPADRTQFWLETAFQIAKMDLQVAMGRFGFKILIRSDDGRKDRWRIAGFPDPDAVPGKPETTGVYRATMGKAAKRHYRRLRGFVPG